MKTDKLRNMELEASTLGELRAAVAAVADLPDSTFVTFTTHMEIRLSQTGSRIRVLHAHTDETDTGQEAASSPTNRAQRRQAEKVVRSFLK